LFPIAIPVSRLFSTSNGDPDRSPPWRSPKDVSGRQVNRTIVKFPLKAVSGDRDKSFRYKNGQTVVLIAVVRSPYRADGGLELGHDRGTENPIVEECNDIEQAIGQPPI
jgi:hypothetical protein